MGKQTSESVGHAAPYGRTINCVKVRARRACRSYASMIVGVCKRADESRIRDDTSRTAGGPRVNRDVAHTRSFRGKNEMTCVVVHRRKWLGNVGLSAGGIRIFIGQSCLRGFSYSGRRRRVVCSYQRRSSSLDNGIHVSRIARTIFSLELSLSSRRCGTASR